MIIFQEQHRQPLRAVIAGIDLLGPSGTYEVYLMTLPAKFSSEMAQHGRDAVGPMSQRP